LSERITPIALISTGILKKGLIGGDRHSKKERLAIWYLIEGGWPRPLDRLLRSLIYREGGGFIINETPGGGGGGSASTFLIRRGEKEALGGYDHAPTPHRGSLADYLFSVIKEVEGGGVTPLSDSRRRIALVVSANSQHDRQGGKTPR